MRLAHKAIAASLLAAFAAGPVLAQNTTVEPAAFGQRRPTLGFAPCPPSSVPSAIPFDTNPPVTANPQGTPPTSDLAPGAERSLAGTGGGRATAMPQSIGDLGSYYRVLQSINVPTFTTTTITVQTQGESGPGTTATITQHTTGQTSLSVYETALSRAGAGFKIGENESPRPMDRISFTYNAYFDTPTLSAAGNTVIGPTTVLKGNLGEFPIVTTTSSTTTIAGIPGRAVDVHRGLFAFEKTFLDGNASVGIRLPVFGMTGGSNSTDPSFIGNAFGDMSLIGKYALINNRDTNNLLSVGLVLTLPTGPAIQTVNGNIDSVLIQPFVGYIYNFSPAVYLQGFSSIVAPTNSNDVTAWFNDVGIGYFAFRNVNPNAMLTAIVPTIEGHVTTPLNHRGDGGIVQAFDIVSITGGVHLGIGRQSWLTFGVNTPVTGPTPYYVEGIVQFNYRF